MDVNDNYEDELEQLKGILHVLGDVHALNDMTEALDTGKLEQGEELEDRA